MEALKYTVIKDIEQYEQYCLLLEDLLMSDPANIEEIQLLTLLIEHYDKENDRFTELDPVELIKVLMEEHTMRPKDLVDYLQVSKGYVSDILNYKKGLSKTVIRKLANRFRMSQEAFNRPYPLLTPQKIPACAV